jgi:hypothetical protein
MRAAPTSALIQIMAPEAFLPDRSDRSEHGAVADSRITSEFRNVSSALVRAEEIGYPLLFNQANIFVDCKVLPHCRVLEDRTDKMDRKLIGNDRAARVPKLPRRF